MYIFKILLGSQEYQKLLKHKGLFLATISSHFTYNLNLGMNKSRNVAWFTLKYGFNCTSQL